MANTTIKLPEILKPVFTLPIFIYPPLFVDFALYLPAICLKVVVVQNIPLIVDIFINSFIIVRICVALSLSDLVVSRK